MDGLLLLWNFRAGIYAVDHLDRRIFALPDAHRETSLLLGAFFDALLRRDSGCGGISALHFGHADVCFVSGACKLGNV